MQGTFRGLLGHTLGLAVAIATSMDELSCPVLSWVEIYDDTFKLFKQNITACHEIIGRGIV